jgi:hypothetical protein
VWLALFSGIFTRPTSFAPRKADKYHNHSGVSSLIAGNIAADLVLTAGISSIVDSANGADNEYTGSVNIALEPLTGAVPTRAAP